MQRLIVEEAQRHLQRVRRGLGEVSRYEDMAVRSAWPVSDYEDRDRHSAQESLDGAAQNDRLAGEGSFTCNAGNDEVDGLRYGDALNDFRRVSLFDQHGGLLNSVAPLDLQSCTNMKLCHRNRIRWRPPRGCDPSVIHQVLFIELLEDMQHCQMSLAIGRDSDCARQGPI